jgi:hypothetical protein
VLGDIGHQPRGYAGSRFLARPGGLIDAPQASQRIGLVSEDRRGHGADVVAGHFTAIAAARPRVDRHPGNQGLVRQLTVMLQVATQCPGADSKHHVIDCHPACRLRIVLSIRGKCAHQHLVRREIDVEARRRHPLFFALASGDRSCAACIQTRRRAHQRLGHTQRREPRLLRRARRQQLWNRRQVRGLLVRRLQRYERRAADYPLSISVAKKRIAEAPSTAAW